MTTIEILNGLKGHFSDTAQRNYLFGSLFNPTDASMISSDVSNTSFMNSPTELKMNGNNVDIGGTYEEKKTQLIYITQGSLSNDLEKHYIFLYSLYQLYQRTIDNIQKVSSMRIQKYQAANIVTITDTGSYVTGVSVTSINILSDTHTILNNHLHFINELRNDKDFHEKLFVYLSTIKLRYVMFIDEILKYRVVTDDIYNKNKSCLEAQITYISTVYFVASGLNNIDSIIGLPIQYNTSCIFNVTGDNYVQSTFRHIDPTKHVIYDIQNQKVYDIHSNTNIQEDSGSGNKYIDLLHCDDTLKDNRLNLKITYRPINYYRDKYRDNVNQIKIMNKQLKDSKDEYSTALTDDKHINLEYKDIYYIYYITIVALIVVFVGLTTGSNNTEQSIINLVLLVGVVVLYIIYIVRYTSIEMFFVTSTLTEDFESDAKELVKIINFYTPIVTLKDVYQEMLNVIEKDTQLIKENNNIIDIQTKRIEHKTTGDWHDYYSKSIFIHSAVMLMIIALVFQWLYINFPSLDFMLIVFASLAILIVIFNYFRNIFKIVRTDHKNMYWTKMRNI